MPDAPKARARRTQTSFYPSDTMREWIDEQSRKHYLSHSTVIRCALFVAANHTAEVSKMLAEQDRS